LDALENGEKGSDLGSEEYEPYMVSTGAYNEKVIRIGAELGRRLETKTDSETETDSEQDKGAPATPGSG
jgi:hypothetical protein